MGFSAYIDDQFAKPATPLPAMAWQPVSQPSNCTSPLTAGGPVDAVNFGTNCPRDLYTQFVSQRYFFQNALTAPDQLRQRVSWALSQIIVTSASPGNEFQMGYALRNYQQIMMPIPYVPASALTMANGFSAIPYSAYFARIRSSSVATFDARHSSPARSWKSIIPHTPK